ncbi:DUF3744 domain-containing protein [Vibrio sp.]|nr:DUF3744 domain-containing protein [Vibrio sp.]
MSIVFTDFSFTYESQKTPTLRNINLSIKTGEKVLIVGPSGSGKSTLGQCLNGLIPHSISGMTSGTLHIAEENVSSFTMHQYNEKVGTVLQDTDSQFVGLSIGEDIAFALENQNVSNVDMYSIVKSTAKMVDLETMLHRSPHQLSGGQKQRVSLAGILVDDVDILLFDEPLAALDPVTSQKTIEVIDDLHQKTRKTMVIIEHRLEEVLHRSIDRIIMMAKGQIIADMTPNELLASSQLKENGIREPLYLSALKMAGWEPNQQQALSPLSAIPTPEYADLLSHWANHASAKVIPTFDPKTPQLRVENLTYSYDNDKPAVNNVTFQVHKGEFLSILGKNGSGKSTISKLLIGVLQQDSGSISLDGHNIDQKSIFERCQDIGVVLQNPNHMISHHMIYDEVAFSLRNAGMDEDTIKVKVSNILKVCGLYSYRNWPIEALSYGQKKRVTIAAILVSEPKILILDEPTAGQDFRNYTAMLSFIKKLNEELAITVIIISHDMHLVLEYSSRSLVFSDGELLVDEPTAQVFSKPKVLQKANLTPTSLYTLSDTIGIQDKVTFLNQFIYSEHHQ